MKVDRNVERMDRLLGNRVLCDFTVVFEEQ